MATSSLRGWQGGPWPNSSPAVCSHCNFSRQHTEAQAFSRMRVDKLPLLGHCGVHVLRDMNPLHFPPGQPGSVAEGG